MKTPRTVFMFGMRHFYLILLLLLTGCGTTHHSSGWSTCHAGPFNLDMPVDLRKTSTTRTDSYFAEFEGKGLLVSFDYGSNANDFGDWPPATEYEMVTIDGKTARIGTVNKGYRSGYKFTTQVSFRETDGKYLAITAACETKSDLARAKKVFRSVKFNPTAP
jgi:hypothetical protein